MDTSWTGIYLLLLIGAIVFTCALIPFARWLAMKTDAIDYPSGRRVNTQPIPRTGGVAVVGGMGISLLIMTVLVHCGVIHTPFGGHPYLDIDWTWAAIGVFLMFLVGFVDDVFDLRPLLKLAGQFASACVVASSGILLSTIGDPFGDSVIALGWFSYPITIIYLVAFANIINLIDGLDGLSSGITIIATVSIMIFASIYSRTDVMILGFALIGALIAFMKFNWHPASIFIGDSGALVLGELLGILSIVAIARSTLFTSMLVPILAAGVPIMDTLLAIIRRKLAHKPIMSADKGHIHHRLLDSGRSQKETVLIMLGWTAFLSASGIGVTLTRGWIRYIIFAVAIILSIILIKRLGVLKPVLAHKYTPRISRRHVNDGTYDKSDYQKVKTDKDFVPEVKMSRRLIDADSSHNPSIYNKQYEENADISES